MIIIFYTPRYQFKVCLILDYLRNVLYIYLLTQI